MVYGFVFLWGFGFYVYRLCVFPVVFLFLFNSAEFLFVARLFSKRKKEDRHGVGWVGRDMGENLGGKIMTRIYHMKKKFQLK